VLQRAGAYVVAFEEKLSALIAEERYEQRLARRGFNRWVRKRETRADVLIVRRRAAGLPWLLFRDIFEVDGRAVRDRERRLEKLFIEVQEGDKSQAQAILDEGARYNLGPVRRNYNVPTLVLAFLHPDLQPYFHFVKEATETIDGRRVVRLGFRETARPTLIGGDTDIPAEGRVWIDPDDGAVARTDLRVEDIPGARGLSAELDTRFRPAAEFGLWLPVEMKDRWQWPEESYFFDARAGYVNFRRPQVEIEEVYTVPE
jgi:hypothetical protein